MKNNFFKIFFLSFFLLTNCIVFAGGPGGDQGGGGLEGDDPFPAPINEKIIWLAIVAIFFAFYTFKNRTKKVL